MDVTSPKQHLRGRSTLAAKARDRLRHPSQASDSNTLNQDDASPTSYNSLQANIKSKRALPKAVGNKIGFLDLPLELRQQIYRYCLVRPEVLLSLNNTFRLPPDPYYISGRGRNENFRALLVLCRQISLEAIAVLYGENIFQVHVASGWKRTFESQAGPNQQQLLRIRRVQFIVDTKGLMYRSSLEEETWASFLAHLSWVSIVAAANHNNRSYGVQHVLYIKEVKEWTKWLGLVLKCFKEHLSQGCYLQIDDNDVEESRAVIEQCFGNSYRTIECPDADLLFRRGDYSWQSGYWDDQIEFWFCP